MLSYNVGNGIEYEVGIKGGTIVTWAAQQPVCVYGVKPAIQYAKVGKGFKWGRWCRCSADINGVIAVGNFDVFGYRFVGHIGKGQGIISI